jgi:DNA-directed RNA polymerase specialized sigma24 family protein
VSAALVESVAFDASPSAGDGADPPSMNTPDFSRLLEQLHADAVQAAQEYERLRRALVKFFDWRGVTSPDECADEVIDRLAHKLGEITVQDVRKYAYGIARLVALERRRGPSFTSLEDAPASALTFATVSEDRDPRQDCFDRCLAQLPDESRALLLRYYEGERTAKISNRRRLASLFGLTDNALRSRVQRLRDRLEECVQGCSARPVSYTT